ncbi:hypothetical protein AALP_AAs53509U000100 [Arabis alpina]|uniref:Uncharacterized protein n=1 Tax=Arabis alpina TaxID=50452 RepID=A0A087G219_ARAAL|nr:hypothetical protein AALP_AAs53509U000100 [Arabis alpina]
MAARIIRVEGNKLWILVKEEPTVEQAARGSPCSSKESREVTPHHSRVKEEAPTDNPMEQDPYPWIFKMTPQPAEGAEVGPPGNPRVQVKRRAVPVHRYWPVGFNTAPRIPKTEPPSPRAVEWAAITFHHVERVLANWRYRFDTITQGDRTVEEYFQEFMLPTARLADDTAKLEKMGRDREPGMFGGLGDTVPAPPTTAAYVDQHGTKPADWPYFLDAYRTHADLRINPSPGKEARRGSNGWLEESDDESDLWSKVKPEWKQYRDSPPSATTPVGTQND